MARDIDHLRAGLDADDTGGLLTGFLAEEEHLDRRGMWRLASWGVASVAAVVLAVYANQSSVSFKRDQFAAADLARQSQQVQAVASAAQSEARRLASVVDTLNQDRDRLYSRVSVLEQGLDSVTGAISRPNSSASSQAQPSAKDLAPAPAVAPVATTAPVDTTAATTASDRLPRVQSPAAAPTDTVASINADEADPNAAQGAKVVVQRTEFGADVGGANSVEGIRALWRGLRKSDKTLGVLRPIIAVRDGAGTQLRLVVGPLSDAAAVAQICAARIENKRTCETTVFDGQRLAYKPEEAAQPAAKPAAPNKRAPGKRAATEEPPPPQQPEASGPLTLFRRQN